MSTGEGMKGQGLTVHIDELGTAWVDSIDPRVAERMRAALADGARQVTLTPSADDTEGHGLGRGLASVEIRLADEDDVEGHAIALRFPSPEDARRFQARMLATGILVATIAAGGAGIATQGFGIGSEAATQQAPITQAASDLAGYPAHGGLAGPSGVADDNASAAAGQNQGAGRRTPGHQPR